MELNATITSVGFYDSDGVFFEIASAFSSTQNSLELAGTTVQYVVRIFLHDDNPSIELPCTSAQAQRFADMLSNSF